MEILITGDLVINQTYDSSKIDQGIIDLFQQSDLNIVNLEAPVTNNNTKLFKTGPHLKSFEADTSTVLKKLKIDICTLANNHIMDYAEQGLLDTLSFCSNNAIESIGAGINKENAEKPKRININGTKISIINFAENEWASATEDKAGANPMDLIDNSKSIKLEKAYSDYVIVIVHGGHEYYNLPSPSIKKQYRYYVENGADLVVGHHTHIISGFEIYKNVPIYYSLGNFLFTKKTHNEDWSRGIVLKVEINQNKSIATTPFFVAQNKENNGLFRLYDDDLNEALNKFDNLSEIIGDDRRLNYEWNKYLEEKKDYYIGIMSPISFLKNKYLKILLHKLGVKITNRRGRAILLNMLRCESHSIMAKEILFKSL